MKVLIIGSKGFIGKALQGFCQEAGFDTYTCDVVVDYVTEKYFLVDAANPDFHSIFESHQFTACINCSGAASVPDSIKDPLRDYLLNTANVFRILNGIRKYQSACKFINLSSAAVYGNPIALPIKEGMPLSPLSPYGVHKMQAEIICKEFYELFGIPTASLRIFSAYGDGLKKQLFWDLHKKAQASKSIDLFGTGMESRDFIYITDLVQAIICVLKNAPFQADVINIGNGKEILIKDAVQCFYKHYDPEVNFSFTSKVREGDPSNWCADISDLRALGYQSTYSFEDGIINFCQWLSAKEKE